MNLPIAERELRVASRNPRTYRGRLVACVIFGCVTGWVFWFATQVRPFNTIAPMVYAFIGQLALLMCMFSATVTADALSSEKRNGTLGLLFLTDLRAFDIVAGKLTAFGIVALFGLLAAIPILSLPVLMGGISGQTVFRTAINLFNALFFALSVGLWISARSWEHKRATNSAVWIVLSMMWVLPFAAAMLRRRPGWGPVAEWLYVLSPVYQQEHASPFGIGMVTDKYWISFAITHALAWIAIWRACAYLPHAWQDRPVATAAGRWRKFWQELRFGSSEVRRALRDQLLRINAVHWLSARERFAPTNAWLFVGAVVGGWIGLWLWVRTYGPNGPPFWGMGIPATMILYLGLRVRACALSGEVIARDRVSGALELLLSTILTEKDVARGQMLTALRTLLWPAIVTILIATGLFCAAMTEILRHGPPDGASQAWAVYIGLVILFACDLVASFWTGLWTACIARSAQAASGQAVLRLLVLPWVIFMGCTVVAAFLKVGPRLEFIDVFTGWWALCMVNNVFWILRSRRNFYERLRAAATERYQPPKSRSGWWRFMSKSARAPQISLSKAA